MLQWLSAILAWSCLASGLALAVGALVEMRHALSLWRARRTSAAQALTAGGIVEIRGRAVSDMPLTAPLTGQSCVLFTVVMERRQPHGSQTRDERPDLLTFVAASRFGVNDGTGVTKFDLRQHRAPVTGASVTRQPLERLTSALDGLLRERLGVPGGLWCMNRDVVATEAALLDGTEVSVVARRVVDPQRGPMLRPLHVMTGRVRLVALQGIVRALSAGTGALVLAGLFQWLR